MKEKARVFIGSSTEGLKYAKALENLLFYEDLEVSLWNKIFRRPLASTIEELQELSNFDFGIIIFTPDDITISRDTESVSPRDNLIFELGLLIGYLGRDRVFPIVPMDINLKLPSDLLGTNPLPFKFDKELNSIEDCEKTLAFAVNRISDAVNSAGIKRSKGGDIKPGVKSNIKIHPVLAHYKSEHNLAFKFAYKGTGSLLDVKVKVYLITTKSKKNTPSLYGNTYKPIELTYESIPELRISWVIRHHYREHTSLEYFLSEENFDANKLLDENSHFKIYITGIDSIDQTKRYESKIFRAKDMKEGIFQEFAFIDENGDVLHNKTKWEDFEKFVESS